MARWVEAGAVVNLDHAARLGYRHISGSSMYVSDSRIGSGARRNIAVLTRLANGFTVRDEVPRGGRFSRFESRLGMGTPAGQWN